jgi:hypothetical protein
MAVKGEAFKFGSCEFISSATEKTLQSLLSIPIRKILDRE